MTYSGTVLALSPAGLWLLDEASGTTAAEAGGPLGAASYTASGITYRITGPSSEIPYGAATNGATNSSRVTFPSLTSYLGTAQAQSFEVWYDATSTVDSSTSVIYLWSTNQGNRGPMWLGAASTGLTNEVFTIRHASGVSTGWSGISLSAGWHHLVVTFSGTADSWKLYVDGAEVTTGRVTEGASGSRTGFPNAGIWYLGLDAAAFSAVRVAAPAIYNLELTSGQVAANYSAGAPSTVIGTVAVTNANDTSAASGSTVTGTLARTNAADTSAAAGSSVTGTAAVTNAADTSSATGTATTTGSVATTNADDTMVAAGTAGLSTITGTNATTNANDTSAATGIATITGTLDRDNRNDTIDASGLVSGTPWPGTGTGTVNVTIDQNRVYARVGDDTNPTRVIKSGSGSTTAVLIDWLLDPVDLTGYTVTFDVARNGINVASTACTLTTPAAGLVTFTFPTLDPGTYTARFTVHYNSLEWSHPVDGLEVQV